MTLLAVLQQYSLWALGDGEVDPAHILLLWWILVALTWRFRRFAMLAGPVLLLGRGLWAVEWTPLAGTEVKGLRTGWQIRVTDGRRVRRVSMITSRAFQEAVERAAERAREAPPGSVPRTTDEARRAVPLLTRSAAVERLAALILLSLALMVLTVWLDHPGLLLILPVAVLFQDRLLEGTTLVLCDATLWFLGERGPVYQIPLSRVRSVQPRGKRWILLQLDDPRLSVLKLERYYGHGPYNRPVDALVQLQKAVAGEPLFSPDGRADARPAEGEGGQPAASGILRCALCGRPEPGSLAPGSVHICERCQNRARYEAQEAGHGLQAREPKPM